MPEQRSVALQDSDGFTIFLRETPGPISANGCALWVQVNDVDAIYAAWSARGVAFTHGPRKSH
jgi:hypothetical protein